MTLRYRGLDAGQFRLFFAMPDSDLAAGGIIRVICDAKPGFPCRITLEDAEPGETLLLLNFPHQPASSPYRANGPIFVREGATAAYDGNDLPPALRTRTLSVRAYDEAGRMVDAALVKGAASEAVFTRMLADPAVAYLHVHNAGRGCYAARVERAG